MSAGDEVVPGAGTATRFREANAWAPLRHRAFRWLWLRPLELGYATDECVDDSRASGWEACSVMERP